MKNVLVFCSLLAVGSLALACGDSSGDGGSGGATTQSTTAPASGTGAGSTKAASGSTSGGNSSSGAGNTTATTAGSGSSAANSSTGAGMACMPNGDPCEDCVFMNCCNEFMACEADMACVTCRTCLENEGAGCLLNGMCDLQDPVQGAFIQCAQTCQAQCQ